MSTYTHQKKLGQNFLCSEAITDQIVNAIDYNLSELIIEIGPGRGALTLRIAGRAKNFIAIEKDEKLIPGLNKKFKQLGFNHNSVIQKDVRDISFSDIAKGKSYSLVGNIPYYLTAYLFRKIFEEEKNLPKEIIFMVQKEVAERITADVSRHSLLSISIQAFAVSRLILHVSRNNFSPAPKVDSAVILVSDISRARFVKHKITPQKFFAIVRAGFSHPRKLLIKNLAETRKVSAEKINGFFSELQLNKKVRAGELSVEQWFLLVSLITNCETQIT